MDSGVCASTRLNVYAPDVTRLHPTRHTRHQNAQPSTTRVLDENSNDRSGRAVRERERARPDHEQETRRCALRSRQPCDASDRARAAEDEALPARGCRDGRFAEGQAMAEAIRPARWKRLQLRHDGEDGGQSGHRHRLCRHAERAAPRARDEGCAGRQTRVLREADGNFRRALPADDRCVQEGGSNARRWVSLSVRAASSRMHAPRPRKRARHNQDHRRRIRLSGARSESMAAQEGAIRRRRVDGCRHLRAAGDAIPHGRRAGFGLRDRNEDRSCHVQGSGRVDGLDRHISERHHRVLCDDVQRRSRGPLSCVHGPRLVRPRSGLQLRRSQRRAERRQAARVCAGRSLCDRARCIREQRSREQAHEGLRRRRLAGREAPHGDLRIGAQR